jgi:hypothetical protein
MIVAIHHHNYHLSIMIVTIHHLSIMIVTIHHHNYHLSIMIVTIDHLSIMIVTIHHLFIIYPSSIHQVNKQLFNKSLTPEQSRYSRDALARVIYKTLFNWIVNEVGR